MAVRRLRRHLSQDEMNRGIGMLHSGLYQSHVANVLMVCPRVLSPECGTGLLRPEMFGICMLGGRECSTNEVQDRFLVVQARATDLTTQQRYVGTSRTLPVCA